MTDNPAADLIARLQNNDSRAFDIIYRKYHQPLYRNILRIVKNEQAALDLLQEVFSTLWEKRFAIKPAQEIGGWLFVISFNKSISYTRKKLRETETFARLPLADVALFDEVNVYHQQYLLLQQAISTLSPQRQRVMAMCKLEGKTYEETAQVLKISKHTVKEYLSLAMDSVRNYVRDHERDWDITLVLILFNFFNFRR